MKLPHCADLTQNNWCISVLQSDCSDSQWINAVTLGHETLNTGVYCQFDKDTAYLVTESLSRFVIVGQSSDGFAVKKLKVAVFAPKLCFQSSVDVSVRVYVLEDTESSMETVFGQEKRLGGYLMDEPKTFHFQDGGNSLCLQLEGITEGWDAKPSTNYQEIPFEQLWHSNSNSLHCTFAFESFEMNSRMLNFKIKVHQKGFEAYQMFNIVCVDDSDVSIKSNSAKTFHDLVPKINIQSETSKSHDSPKSFKQLNQEDSVNSPKCAKNYKVSILNYFESLLSIHFILHLSFL